LNVEVVLRAQAEVGESPVWCERRKLLWWVDITAGLLHAFSPETGEDRSWDMNGPIGCIGLTEGEALLVGLREGIYLFEPGNGEFTLVSQPESHLPGNRPNDATMSRDGRFFVGTMAQKPDGTPRGHLYRIDPDGRTHHLLDGLHVPNGLAVSPDNRTLYLSDSWNLVRQIWAFDLDDQGNISNRRPFFDTTSMPGRPDGACLDADGGYWSAAIDGGELLRLLPDGAIDQCIPVPLKKPTKPCFGGPDLSTLFVTSLGTGDDSECAGAILAIRPGRRGLEEPRMKIEFEA
jgi:L-arabinonolactonase